MPTNAQQKAVLVIDALVAEQQIPKCPDITLRDANGYHIAVSSKAPRVAVGYVAGQGRAHTQQQDFVRTMLPLLEERFGEARVRRTSLRLRVGGKIRMVPVVMVAGLAD